ncbi:MAG: hypothetical protein ACP5JL_09880, partial [bacterium]
MWDELYQQALEKGWEKLQNIPGVITGFHSTIDGLKRVDENLIAELLKQFPELKTLPEEPTSTIGKPLDFLTDLLVSIKNGLAYQRMIEDEKT